MNRRLFVRQAIAGVSLLSVPSSLLARSVALPQVSTSFSAVNTWLQSGALGTLQRITLSCVYSPECTSLPVLKALVQAKLADVNTLLQTNFTLPEQTWAALSMADFGSFGTEINQGSLTLAWQGLARINHQPTEPVARLQLWGSQGIIQCLPGGKNYQLIELPA